MTVARPGGVAKEAGDEQIAGDVVGPGSGRRVIARYSNWKGQRTARATLSRCALLIGGAALLAASPLGL